MNEPESNRITTRQLLAFFLPLGLSSTLVTISHVIINSTLARSPDPEFIIASYAIPLSFIALTERPVVLLRQTCSALVRDRISFRAMASVSNFVLISVMLVSALVAYTPLGEWVFRYLFAVEEALLQPIIHVYRILMFVIIFSGIRCLYHGIIIFNMRTKWLTIGMVIRLAAMYLLSLYFIHRGVDSGQVGAIIFLVGMIIESAVAVMEGRRLLKKEIPEKKPEHEVETKSQIFKFYKPLLYSSFVAAIIGPAINAMLGKTVNIQLAIASFSLASSLNLLVLSFFTYLHQIILNFYNKDTQTVKRFVFIMAFIPGLLTGLLGFTPLGPLALTHVMGVSNDLMSGSLSTLRVLALYSLIYPWIDICNGIVMLRAQTAAMLKSQSMNMTVTICTLVLCVLLAPGWNGVIGALAQSFGVAAELITILWIIRSINRSDMLRRSLQIKSKSIGS